MKSLGVIETRGLTAAIQAADAACKAANVEIAGYRKVGSGLVSVCFLGEISAMHTAIESGIAVISQSELVIGSLVIARPEPSVITKLLTPEGKKKISIITPKVQSIVTEKTATVIENVVEKTQQSQTEKAAPIVEKDLTDPVIQNVALETKAVTDKDQDSKKEIKSEGRKGKK